MMEHRFRTGWFDYAPNAHRALARQWLENHGVPVDPQEIERSGTWDSETKVLTVGQYQTVTKTPPPWPFR